MTSTCSSSSSNPILLNVVIENVIFPKLSLSELGACSRVSKAWKEMAKKHLNAFSHPHAFGPKEWYAYFGTRLRNIRRLPSNLTEIMNSACPFWPDKKVHETHVLILVPQAVDGKPLTIKTLEVLVQKPLQGYKVGYNFFNLREYVEMPFQSHWALLTRTVIEGSRNKTFKEQLAVIAKYNQNTTITYEIPTALDVVLCNFLEYVRSGIWLYGRNPLTYTWCQEKYDTGWNAVVGSGSSASLECCFTSLNDCPHIGVGGLRKL